MKTVCRPSDRDGNWRPPVQGKPHNVQVKEPYGHSNWLLVGIHPANRGMVYNVHRLCLPRKFRRYGRKKVRKNERKAVCYAIAHKNMLFSISRNMIWIVLKYCFC